VGTTLELAETGSEIVKCTFSSPFLLPPPPPPFGVKPLLRSAIGSVEVQGVEEVFLLPCE